MDLTEALELSNDLSIRFMPKRGPRPLALLGTLSRMPAGPARWGSEDELESKLGVGVSPGKGPRDWRVAIRAWHKEDLEQKRVEREVSRLRDAVDIRITGPIRALPAEVPQPIADIRRQRPLVPGCSIAHYQVGAGTLGAFVRDGSGQVQILSNNHVLAQVNEASIGDVILQPGKHDGGVMADKVGQLKAFHWLQDAGNVVDAAVADIEPQHLPSDFSIPGIGRIAGVFPGAQPVGAGRVQKVGRSTGKTDGHITALGLRNLPVQFGSRTLRFDNVVEIEGTDRPFSDSGDSGSLIVNADRLAVGLLFGGTGQSTYCNPVAKVLEVMALQLL